MFPKRLRPLLPYIRRYRWGYIGGMACIFLTNGIQVLGPKVLGVASDALLKGITRHKLFFFAGLLLAIALGKGIFQFLTRWIMIGISRDIEFDLRNDLFARLERLSYSYYQRHRTGDIMARATNDLGAVRNLLGPAIMYSANTAVLMTLALAFMISLSPRLTLYTFLTTASNAFRPCSPTFRRARRKISPERASSAPMCRKKPRSKPSSARIRNTFAAA